MSAYVVQSLLLNAVNRDPVSKSAAQPKDTAEVAVQYDGWQSGTHSYTIDVKCEMST